MARLTKIIRQFTVVVPTVMERYNGALYTWDYGTFIVEALFEKCFGVTAEGSILLTIKVYNPEKLDCPVAYFDAQDYAGQCFLADQYCVNLISGIKEKVELTLRELHHRLLTKVNELAGALELVNRK